jgi:hypothetical protein
MARSLSLAPLAQLRSLAGQEHGRTIPLADYKACPHLLAELFYSLDEVAHLFGWLAKLRLHEFVSPRDNVCGSFTPFDVESVVMDFYRRDKGHRGDTKAGRR